MADSTWSVLMGRVVGRGRQVATWLICRAQGHNVVGVDLPPGWSWQTCRTCGQRVRAHRREEMDRG